MTDTMTTDRAAVLLALADRVEAGERGREIDTTIMVMGGWCLHRRTERNGPPGDIGHDCLDCGANSWGSRGKTVWKQQLHDTVPSITTSLDAIAAFTEAVLPGWRIVELVEWPGKAWKVTTKKHATNIYRHSSAPTEPAARLSAALRALAVEAGRG